MAPAQHSLGLFTYSFGKLAHNSLVRVWRAPPACFTCSTHNGSWLSELVAHAVLHMLCWCIGPALLLMLNW
jgi:hypothetical protein